MIDEMTYNNMPKPVIFPNSFVYVVYILVCRLYNFHRKKMRKDKNFKNIIKLSCFRHQMRMVETLVKMAVKQT
jgi:hypothetical protein